MRLSSNLLKTFTPLIFLIPSLVIGITIDCSHVRVDGVDFDFSPLDAPHAIWTIEDHPPSYTNTTFTVNICRPLKKTKGVPKDEDCNNNARVCAIERLYNPSEDVISVEKTVNIAGEFSTTLGGALDPAWTRLKSSKSTADREKEGVRLELHGGKYQKQDQMAIIEFLCKKDDDGKDTEKRDEDKEEPPNHDDGGSEQGDGHGGTLKYISWETEDDKAKVLRLEWNTKFACEDAAGAGGSQSSSHWGFFTWLIIILFMGVAAYLIFGSWLNYNRYSARGWDVLPHSDTIQDLPYLFRDWMRKIISTVQGGGSRGGYSAV